MKIHERLKALREDHDLTQEEAARALKTTRAQIWKYKASAPLGALPKNVTETREGGLTAPWY